VDALVEAVRADPGQLDARYDLVLALLETGQLDQAWEQVLRLDVASPEDPQVLALAAWVAVRLRRFDEARGWATGALSAAPDSALANLAVGVSLLAEDDAAAAEPFLRAAADADPGPTVSLELGLALLDLEQWAKARAAFDRVLLDDPENAVALAGAGAAAAAAGDVIEAKRLLESALEADAEGTLGRAAQETAASLLEALRGEE
jgi:tetratricopeptide (TPR) repeat protein